MKTIQNSFFLLLLFLVFSTERVKAQVVPLPASLGKAELQLSGLALWNKKLLFLPQMVGIDTFRISYVDAEGLEDDPLPASFEKRTVQTLQLNDTANFLFSIKKNEGFEAMTVVKDTLFLLLETTSSKEAGSSSDSCYVFRAVLKNNKVFLTHKIALAKIKNTCSGQLIPNAGFEGISYLGSGKLLILFEYGAAADGMAGYTLATSFQELPRPVFWDKPLCFRLTDLYTDPSGNTFGLHQAWGGDYEDYMINACPCLLDIPSLAAIDHNDPSLHFAQIIQIKKAGECTYTWAPVTAIDGRLKSNWEGLIRIGKMFYVVSDTNITDNSLPAKGPNSKTLFARLKL